MKSLLGAKLWAKGLSCIISLQSPNPVGGTYCFVKPVFYKRRGLEKLSNLPNNC